jgi:hypothetical protein
MIEWSGVELFGSSYAQNEFFEGVDKSYHGLCSDQK